MGEDRTVCVGLDTHKAKIAVAVAEPGRAGEVRFHGEIANQPDAVRRLIERLADKHGRLRVCYEAGPCGYGLQRQITALGHDCTVVAPSLVPRRPGDRVKTNRRDAVTLARLHRAGELTAVWMPDPTHEAMRDLVRARTAAMEAVRRARQQLQGFLLRHEPGVHGPQDLVAGAPALAGRAPLRPSRPADRAAGADRRDRGGRAPPRPSGPADQGAGAGLVDGTGGHRPAGDARHRLPLGGGAGGRGRGLPPLRQPPPAHGLAGSGAIRALERRQGRARRHHQGRERPRTPGAGRGCLELPLPGAGHEPDPGPAGRGAGSGAGDRLEGAAPAVRPLPAARGAGKNVNVVTTSSCLMPMPRP